MRKLYGIGWNNDRPSDQWNNLENPEIDMNIQMQQGKALQKMFLRQKGEST